VATWVVFKAPKPPPNDFQPFHIPPQEVRPPPPPPVPSPTVRLPSPTSASPAIIFRPNGGPSFTPKPLDLNPIIPANPAASHSNAFKPVAPADLFHKRFEGIKNFILKGQQRSIENILAADNDPNNYQGTFVVYLASYADGDWSCNVTLNNGAIEAGSLPNLIAKMNEWHGKMHGTVVPTPLNIGSSDLMDKKPPFILFTGHKDFKLNDQEVRNLQDYVQNGGAIWGDNCLAGYGSRFDVAFRREMRRVIPDLNKDFENVPMDHAIFTKSCLQIDTLPQGMNYYDEPIEHIDLDGEPAIIYTPNDYSDLFCMRILPGDQTVEGWQPRFGSGSPLFTYGSFGANANIFFRNFTLPASLKAQQLGVNIIGYLLVRFDKYFLLDP
jgi:hypothetical protein